MTQRVPASHVRVRRAYDAQAPGDGARILVDRLWPRGLKKEALGLDRWAKEVAPSTALHCANGLGTSQRAGLFFVSATPLNCVTSGRRSPRSGTRRATAESPWSTRRMTRCTTTLSHCARCCCRVVVPHTGRPQAITRTELLL